MQLLILGMHRSGTSVLTHLLSSMGCHAGAPESLKPGDSANEKGYWERWDAWAVNEQILAAARASWWEVADLDLGSLAGDVRERFEAHVRDLVADLDEHRPWVLKDPRLCVLLPMWQPALSNPVFVIAHRDPLETARSLLARDGLPLAVGIALWEVYNLAALRDSLGAPRLCVSHNRLLSDPGAVSAHLVASLAPFAPGALKTLDAEELSEVVSRRLHHQSADPREHAGYLNGSQQALYQALEDGTALAWEVVPPPSAGALATLRSFASNERGRLTLSRSATEHAQRCAEAEGAAIWRREREVESERWIASLQDALAVAEDELGRLRRRDAEISSWNEALAARLSMAEGEAGRLRTAQLGELARQREVEELQRVLAEMAALAERSWLQADELSRLVEEILGSLIWRVGRGLTAPARWGKQAILAESHYEEMRNAAEGLAAARRALAMQAMRWIPRDDPPEG